MMKFQCVANTCAKKVKMGGHLPWNDIFRAVTLMQGWLKQHNYQRSGLLPFICIVKGSLQTVISFIIPRILLKNVIMV